MYNKNRSREKPLPALHPANLHKQTPQQRKQSPQQPESVATSSIDCNTLEDSSASLRSENVLNDNADNETVAQSVESTSKEDVICLSDNIQTHRPIKELDVISGRYSFTSTVRIYTIDNEQN